MNGKSTFREMKKLNIGIFVILIISCIPSCMGMDNNKQSLLPSISFSETRNPSLTSIISLPTLKETIITTVTRTLSISYPTKTNTPKPIPTFKPSNTITANMWILTELPISIHAIAIDPQNNSIIYAAGGYSIYRSTDGGIVWNAFESGLPIPISITSLTIDPKNPTTIFAGSTNGLYKYTTDTGQWKKINGGIPAKTKIHCIIINPINTSIIYAGALVNPATGYSDGIVLKSTDGGEEWNIIKSDMLFAFWVSLVIDPHNPNTLYMGIDGSMYKSINGGTNWNQINHGLSNIRAFSLAIDPLSPSTLYVGTADGVYKSTNSGLHWIAIGAGIILQSEVTILSINIDPKSSSTIYVLTSNINYTPMLYKSTNSGNNWVLFNNGFPENEFVDELAIDPINPTKLYAGSYKGIYVMHQVPIS